MFNDILFFFRMCRIHISTYENTYYLVLKIALSSKNEKSTSSFGQPTLNGFHNLHGFRN